MGDQKDDLEAGSSLLQTLMGESHELRWMFVRKVYVILSLQLLLTIAVAAVVASNPGIFIFLVTTWAGRPIYIAILVATIIVLIPLYVYRQKHPLNFLFLGIYTLGFAIVIGIGCTFTNGKVILEAVILTASVVVGLTLYTFWAVRRGHDFSFLRPFLYISLCCLVVFNIFQIWFPLVDRVSLMIYGCIGAIVFCGYIIYDTYRLIARFSYDDYIWASVTLYLDVLNLFAYLLTIFRAAE